MKKCMNELFNEPYSGLFVQGLTVEWSKIEADSYLWDIPTIGGLTALQFRRPVTFMVGENGSGKSTLLEAMAIAAGFNPEGGTKNYAFSTYASHSGLYRALRLVRGCRQPEWGYFLRAESFYNVATQEEAYAEPERPSEKYHEKSHGESFLAVAHKHFRPNSLYFLDEPEAALSAQRQLTLLIDIYNCAAEGSQFFIATHSPILLGLPGAEILAFDENAENGLQPCAYEETAAYQITEMFINNRRQLLRHLQLPDGD